MSRISEYRAELGRLDDWEPYLLSHSGLPGPRGNLELAHAVAQEGAEAQFQRWAALGPDEAPENTPQAFLAFCGVLGLGALLATRGADADRENAPLQIMRRRASDLRWRIREAVATGLQLWGDADFDGLLAEMRKWAEGNYLEQRAAAAALCEPRLLAERDRVLAVLGILDTITGRVAAAPAGDRKAEAFRILRQALGYCWSVAVAADPERGIPELERWARADDVDVRWIVRENLGKKRLARVLTPEQIARLGG